MLAGLHPAYEPIRVHILGNDPLLPLDEVFSYLSQEEDRRNLMTQSSQPIIDRSALVSSIQRGGRGSFRGRDHGVSPYDDKDKLKCEHCGPSRHTKETCWDLHGRPPGPPQQFQPQTQRGRGGFRPQGQFSAHSVTSSSEQASSPVPIVDSSSFFANQIEALHRFMVSLEPSSSAPTSSFAQSSTLAFAFSASINTPHHS